jgi:hypothetical protein
VRYRHETEGYHNAAQNKKGIHVGRLYTEQWVVIRLDFLESGFPVVMVMDLFEGVNAEKRAYSCRQLLERQNLKKTSSHTRVTGDASYIVRKVGAEEAQ